MHKTARARSRLSHASSHHLPLRHSSALSLKSLTTYLRFLPLLLFAAIFYAALAWLITHVHPTQIKSWLLPNSFIPFHVLLLLGNFFLFTFLTLSKRWGIFVALAIEWLVFLKLQNFTLDVWAWSSAIAIGTGGYWARTWWKHRQ